jgi:uncharacterized protein YdeI (YjbR/CyaY-like superfamily)
MPGGARPSPPELGGCAEPSSQWPVEGARQGWYQPSTAEAKAGAPGHPLDARLRRVATDSPVLTVRDARAWHSWLTEHHGDAGGVWLVLAKRGAAEPTSLAYDQALEEALCFGWIDGQLGPGDEATFRRRFAPRRPGSSWSKRNVALVGLLTREERMQPAGMVALERAKTDGSWGSAYSGQAAIEVPSDLASALAAHPAAQETFDNLSRANRYAVLYRRETAKRSGTRSQRIDRFVEMLECGETLPPQAPPAQPRSLRPTGRGADGGV